MPSIGDLFSEVCSGGYKTSGMDVQYKLIGKILYFQYSDSAVDWRNNFDFPAVPYRDMKTPFRVHKGFLRAWKSVQEEVMALEFDTIIGYSHGAALAGFAHEDFLYRRGYQPASIVFGCPRFLWMPPRAVKGRWSQFLRVSTPTDIVTHLPPAIMGYRHIGDLRVLGGKAERPQGYPILQWITGHSPFEYAQRINLGP